MNDIVNAGDDQTAGSPKQGRARQLRQTSSSMPEAAAGSALPEKFHVLVVSTNQTTIANLRSALAALGYHVRASRNIAAGIKRFRLTSPDLLIIDAGLL